MKIRKLITNTLILLITLTSNGCFTMMGQQDKVVHKNFIYFKALSAWYNPKSGAVAVSGTLGDSKEPYYLILPSEIAQGMINSERTLFTRDVGKLPDSAVAKLKLIKGNVPSEYLEMKYISSARREHDPDYIRTDKSVTHIDEGAAVGRVVLLPFTVTLDVITLPLQLLILPNMKSFP